MTTLKVIFCFVGSGSAQAQPTSLPPCLGTSYPMTCDERKKSTIENLINIVRGERVEHILNLYIHGKLGHMKAPQGGFSRGQISLVTKALL